MGKIVNRHSLSKHGQLSQAICRSAWKEFGELEKTAKHINIISPAGLIGDFVYGILQIFLPHETSVNFLIFGREILWEFCGNFSEPHREGKKVHNHHRKKIFWRTVLASKKNFPGRWWIQKPYKNQENPIHHRNLSSVDPIFSAKKSSALEQGGVRILFPSHKIKAQHFRGNFRSVFREKILSWPLCRKLSGIFVV